MDDRIRKSTSEKQIKFYEYQDLLRNFEKKPENNEDEEGNSNAKQSEIYETPQRDLRINEVQ